MVSALALVLSLTSSPAMASETLAAQIDQAVQRHLSQRLARQAEREGWRGMRWSKKGVVLPNEVPGQPCTLPLQVHDENDKPPALTRQRLTVQCPGSQGWKLVVTTQTNVFVQAVVTTQVLERGQAITSAMLEQQEVNLGKQRRGVIASIEDVTGLSAKRRIRAQQVLSTDMLVSPWLVRRGDKVKVTARQGEIQAAIQGLAMEDGRLGAVVRVKNPGSGKIIEARVTGAREVTSTLEGERASTEMDKP
ncbi:flagellar basal body P-ring formation chaperone FlgA [Pseudomonas sp. PB3P13]